MEKHPDFGRKLGSKEGKWWKKQEIKEIYQQTWDIDTKLVKQY